MAPNGPSGPHESCGIDMQLISPRPFQMMHSEKPAKIVHYWTEETNNVIHRSCTLMPDNSSAMAGLPQAAGAPIEECLRRARPLHQGARLQGLSPESGSVTRTAASRRPRSATATGIRSTRSSCELGRSGPHPCNRFSRAGARALHSALHQRGDDRRVRPRQLDRPRRLSGAQDSRLARRRGRSRISSAASTPDRCGGTGGRFRDRMRRLYFDTVLYTKDALELLIKTVGADHVLYGAECPGVGSAVDPETGRTFDDIVPPFRKHRVALRRGKGQNSRTQRPHDSSTYK